MRNNRGGEYIIYSYKDYYDAMKRWGSADLAGYHLDVDAQTIRTNLGIDVYTSLTRNTPIISQELYDQEVTKSWR